MYSNRFSPGDMTDFSTTGKASRKVRRAPVSLAELADQLAAIEVARHCAVLHVEEVGVLAQRNGENEIGTVAQEAVAVDPSLLRVLDVVVDDEQVYRGDELEISDVGEEIGLHDGDLHGDDGDQCELCEKPRPVAIRLYRRVQHGLFFVNAVVVKEEPVSYAERVDPKGDCEKVLATMIE